MEKLIKKITITPKYGRYAGREIDTGWRIVEIDGEKVYLYESDNFRSRIEYRLLPDTIIRYQPKGKVPFIYKDRLVFITKANNGTVYDAELAQKLAFEDGIFKNIGNRPGDNWITIANNTKLRQQYAKYF